MDAPPLLDSHCSGNDGLGGVQLPTAHCPLPTADCPLPTADCPLPTADCPLPTIHRPNGYDSIVFPTCISLLRFNSCRKPSISAACFWFIRKLRMDSFSVSYPCRSPAFFSRN